MPTIATPVDRLKLIINSNSPLVVIDTVEENRAVTLVRLAGADLQMAVFEWSVADGLVRYDKKAPAPQPTASAGPPKSSAVQTITGLFNLASHGADDQALAAFLASQAPAPILNTLDPAGMLAHIATMNIPAVFILKDFQRHLDNAAIARRLRELTQDFAASGSRTLVITGASITLPPELDCEAEYLDLPLPDRNRLKQITEETFSRLAKKLTLKRTCSPTDFDAIAANLSGLTEEEATRAVAQGIITHNGLTPDVVTDVLQVKKEALRRSGLLEFIDTDETLANVGGLGNLRKWLSRRKGTWDDSARAAGLDPPRGVVILGVQGCGKSMCARAIAGEWKLPLVKFDTSAIYDKFVGETEKHIHKMFAIAEQLAPAVLWIDELEKVFAGSGPDSASGDSGVSARMLGSFLGWMQDRKAAVFVAATCNNVNALPPELIRKGRFDEIFFVDLPNTSERRDIFKVQLTRKKQNPAAFDLLELAKASQGFSGAEIEAAIKSAMYTAFSDKKTLTTDVILGEMSATVPLSSTRAEDIEALRDWAQERAVQASYPEAAETSA